MKINFTSRVEKSPGVVIYCSGKKDTLTLDENREMCSLCSLDSMQDVMYEVVGETTCCCDSDPSASGTGPVIHAPYQIIRSVFFLSFCALPISPVREGSLSLQQNRPSFPFSIHVWSPFSKSCLLQYIRALSYLCRINNHSPDRGSRSSMNEHFFLSFPYMSSIWDRGVVYTY